MSVYGPFPVDAAIAQLRGATVLKFVGNAADLRAALASPPSVSPAAYVLAQERGEQAAGASGGLFVQRVVVAVQVVLMVRNYAGVAGSGARADMDAAVAACRQRLLNWSPDIESCEPLSFQGNRDESFDAGLLICQDIYKTRYRIQVNP